MLADDFRALTEHRYRVSAGGSMDRALRSACEPDFVERVTKQLDELKTRDAGA